jgi:hypothetical protein
MRQPESANAFRAIWAPTANMKFAVKMKGNVANMGKKTTMYGLWNGPWSNSDPEKAAKRGDLPDFMLRRRRREMMPENGG